MAPASSPDSPQPDAGDPAFARVDTLVIVGLGLIGGSVALAARSAGIVGRVVAVARNVDSLKEALATGLADEATDDLAGACARADLVLLARPVDAIVRDLETVMRAAPGGALVTDAGSTKGCIVAAAEAHSAPGGAQFVGSHPMAGSDRTGWRHARADLFRGATAFITPTEKTDPAASARAGDFWRAIGSRLIVAHPDRHDELAAMVSHVPHLAAVALVEQLAASGEDPDLLGRVAGSGFRDTTRVAKGDEELWLQICRQNGRAVASELESLADRLRTMADQVRACGTDEAAAGYVRGRLADARVLRKKFDGGE